MNNCEIVIKKYLFQHRKDLLEVSLCLLALGLRCEGGIVRIGNVGDLIRALARLF